MVNDLDTLMLFASCSYSDLLAVFVSKWNIKRICRNSGQVWETISHSQQAK